MSRLEKAQEFTYRVLDSLDDSLQYNLAFSGGKDSHALLAMVLKWQRDRGKQLKLRVVFSDMLLEVDTLYKLIEPIENFLKVKGVAFIRTIPKPTHTFWTHLWARGYAVPDYKIRWCTSLLKLDPMKKFKGMFLTGAHEGESINRDKRLKTCGSSECGIDKISKTTKIEPLSIWLNCDVWDFLGTEGDELLYEGVFLALDEAYSYEERQERDKRNSSLRMGCFMCPVIARDTLIKKMEAGAVPLLAIRVRDCLEELRQQPRIPSPKGARGAILWESRVRVYNNRFRPLIPEIMSKGWITAEEVSFIEQALQVKTYPPSYSQKWIEENEGKASVY